MKISMGGERLGARPHGGHVPPLWASGFADGSTGIGARPDQTSVRVGGGTGRGVQRCKKNWVKRMNDGSGLNPMLSQMGCWTVQIQNTYHLYTYIGPVQVGTGRYCMDVH